jgi:hypothetical protein
MRTEKGVLVAGLLVAFLASLAGPGHASFLDDLKDPQEGGLDASKMLASPAGFLPIPIIVTEPAVGYGGGLGILYIHKSKKDSSAGEEFDWDTPRTFETPNLSGLVGLGTENGTWAVGGMHFGSWFEDRVRYLGVAGYASVNLTFYGIGDVDFGSTPLDYNLKAFFLIQEIKARIARSDLFAGARYTFANADSTFDIGGDLPVFIQDRLEVRTGGFGPVLEYDSRDNILSPNRGISAQANGLIYDPVLGGDTHYFSVRSFAKFYRDVLKKKLLLGLRLDGRFSGGDVPFYAYPFIDMRGIPAMRYQGEYAFVTEGQVMWNCWRRWYLLGFLGSGWAVNSLSELALDNAEISKGFGFRYLMARVYGLRVGIDVARGPEKWAFYIQVGSAWGR